MLAAAVSVLFYAPWSATWNSERAYDLHVHKDYPAAEHRYLRDLELGFDPAWVWGNVARLYQATGDTQQYDHALAQLRAADPRAAREIERPKEQQSGRKQARTRSAIRRSVATFRAASSSPCVVLSS
jgi:hypothetical protein